MANKGEAGVDLYTPSDGIQPTMPDKEQLRLEALRAARESWLQALRAAGLASRARQDAALAQASRQALLEDLRCASSAMSMRQLRLALAAWNRRQAESAARVAAEQLQRVLGQHRLHVPSWRRCALQRSARPRP